jgi:hypothetical protein
MWRGELARRFPTSNSIRYFIPPVAVLGIVGGGVFGLVGLVTGNALLTAALLIPGVYAVFVVLAALETVRNGAQAFLWYLIVLPTIHFGWGVGFLLGFLKLTRNITARTGR